MILTRINFYSVVLRNHVDVDILLPSMDDNEAFLNKNLDEIYAKKKYPVLYLLHGAFDDHTMWSRNTHIERYAQKHQIAIVMPSGQNGFYTDSESGLNYYTFMSEELPRLIETYFPVSEKREDHFIAGASMGGYGATRIALSQMENYAAFADFSGALDPETLEPAMKEIGFDFFRYDLLFGGSDKVKGTENDVYHLAVMNKDKTLKPEAFIYCGLQDSVNHGMNLKFYDLLIENGYRAHFKEGDGGHDWIYWEKCIEDFLDRIFDNYE